MRDWLTEIKKKNNSEWIYKETRAVCEDMERLRPYKS